MGFDKFYKIYRVILTDRTLEKKRWKAYNKLYKCLWTVLRTLSSQTIYQKIYKIGGTTK